MNHNPYKFNESLDPVKDKPVCIPRKEEINKVLSGLFKGDYWAVLGPRQIGKTTFLKQVKHTVANTPHIYLNLKAAPSTHNDFYQWFIYKLENEIPSKRTKSPIRWRQSDPGLEFSNFLEKFTPEEDKRIIMIFDDISYISYAESFLSTWKRIFHERNYKKELLRYSVIISGAVDVKDLISGPASPFNMAKTIYMKDFSKNESEILLDEPLKQLNIQVESHAKEELLSHLGGHPQILQHACHLLVEKSYTSNKIITLKEVKYTLEMLKVKNTTLDILRETITKHSRLQRLVEDILSGRRKKFYPHKEFYLLGAGAIVNRDDYCAIRNPLYEEVLIAELDKTQIEA
jgi:energy-coupling factor transporter ATP-binding protein EcfA2